MFASDDGLTVYIQIYKRCNTESKQMETMRLLAGSGTYLFMYEGVASLGYRPQTNKDI